MPTMAKCGEELGKHGYVPSSIYSKCPFPYPYIITNACMCTLGVRMQARPTSMAKCGEEYGATGTQLNCQVS